MSEIYRVYNRCRHDIGVKFQDGRQYNIKPGKFVFMDKNDIAMVENSGKSDKSFAQGKLVATDDNDNPVDIKALFRIAPAEEKDKHHTDDEIKQKLSQTAKKFETWINEITDEVELYNIWMVAKDMDLPASKLKILKDKMPNREII